MVRKKTINIFGSTGQIGTKTLKIISTHFPNIKINLLVANKNVNKLVKQINQFKPKYIYLKNDLKIKQIKNNINLKTTKIINNDEIFQFINSNKTDMTILASSGYETLEYLPSIFDNTKFLGIVNKETIVSAGHLFSNMNKKNYTIVLPLDSEHYSLSKIININKIGDIKKVYLTASGGPFYKSNINLLKNISFSKAKKHPKWKMGLKNSIDSATLANKCLELIEARYLFNIPFNKLDIVINPEALIHSIIEYKNYMSVMSYFYHDMFIPLFNFLNTANQSSEYPVVNKKYNFNKILKLNFDKPNLQKYPIFKLFNEIDKSDPTNLIKFNCSNEFAVDLFAKKKINFTNIHKIIANSLSIDLNINVNNVNDIIEFQRLYVSKLRSRICI